MRKLGKRIAIYSLPIAMILIMLIAPIRAWSGDRPSHDNVASNWLFSYEKPPVGNNPNGPVTDFNEQSFSDSRVRLATELVSYTQNYGGTAQNPYDKYTFRLMASATSRPDHVLPAPSYKYYQDINQCPSRGSLYCIDTGINTKNGGKWVDITWPFNFYGQVYTKVFICSNGYVAFVYVPTATTCPNPLDSQGNLHFPGSALDSNGNFAGVPTAIIAPYMKALDASYSSAKIYYTVYITNDPIAPLSGSYGQLWFGVTWYDVPEQGIGCNTRTGVCWPDCYPCYNTFSLTFDSDGNIFYWYRSDLIQVVNGAYFGGGYYGLIGVNDASGTMSTMGSASTVNSGSYSGVYMRDPNYDVPANGGYPQYNAWLNDLKLRFSDQNALDALNPTGNPWYGKDIQSSPPPQTCDATCQGLGKIALFALVQGICAAVTDGLCLVAEAADLGLDVGQPFLASMPVATFGSHWMNCQGGANGGTGCIDEGYLELPTVQQDGNCKCGTDSDVFLSAVDWIVPHDSSTHSLTIRFGAEMGTYQGGNSFSDTGNTRGWATITLTADAGDFTISASPQSGTVLQGSSSNFNVNLYLTNLAAAGTTISLSTNLPACPNTNGLCASFSPASVSLNPGQSGSSTMTVYAGSGASAGGQPTTITITGTDPTTALMHSSQVSVTVVQPDFSISANPSSINTYIGAPGTSTITLTSLNTFAGNVILSTNAPQGFTATVNPSSVSVPSGGTASSTLTVSISGSPAVGTYTVTVAGSSGSLSHPVYISVSVPPPDFSLSASPTAITALVGTSRTSTITLGSLYGFSGNVVLSASAPAGFTATLNPSTVSVPSGGAAPSTLAVSISGTPSNGVYTITVTGTSGALSHSVAVTVTYSPPFADDLSYNSISAMVTAGWTQCGDGSSGYYSIGNSILTLINDGSRAGVMCWNNTPAGASNWVVTIRSAATGGSYATLPLIVNTAHHQYYFLADGYTSYKRYSLNRDGINIATTPIGSYNPQFNVYHMTRMTMSNNVLTVYFDGNVIFTYTEPDSGTGLTSITLFANWETTDSYDYVGAANEGPPYQDDFNDQTLNQVFAAGWTQCGDSSSSYYRVGSSILTLVNDGSRAGSMCWSNVPSGTSNWSVAVKEAATGGSYATLPLIVNTAHHSYYFLADGYTSYLRFSLNRDGANVATTPVGSYNAQFNVYHTIQITMSNNVLKVFFDSTLIFTYTEPDSGTNLTSGQLFANWEATDSYDWITITSP